MRHALLALVVTVGVLLEPGACRAQDATDLPAGEKLLSFEGHLMKARWSQDGKTVLTCVTRKPKDEKDDTYFHFKTVTLWDAAGKQRHSLGELELPGFPFYYLSADGTRLAISQGFFLSTGELEVWDARRANLDHRIAVGRRPRPMQSVAVSANGASLAVLYYDVPDFAPKEQKRSGGVDLYDAATGKKVQALREEKSLPRTAVFTPDGKSILTRGSNDLIRLWDVRTGKVVREAQASLGSSGELAISPDGRRLVIPTMKHEPLQLWSVPELKALGVITNPFHTVMRTEFSPGGKRLLVAGFRDDVRGAAGIKLGVMVWDLERKEMLHDWNAPSVWCGFCGEDHVDVGSRNAITRYPIGPRAKVKE
jgi:WD40 repeat protein